MNQNPKILTPLPLESLGGAKALKQNESLQGKTVNSGGVPRKKRKCKERIPAPKFCTVPGCDRETEYKALRVCGAHYQRWIKNGDYLANIPITKSNFGERNSKWRGGEMVLKDDRVVIYAPNHPCPNVCKIYVYRYRLIMEKHLDRYLLPSEVVHHKNGIPNDDRIENLEVMTQSEHAKLHNINGKFSSKTNI